MLIYTVIFFIFDKAESVVPDLIKIFGAAGCRLNTMILHSVLAITIYPLSVYMGHQEARNHLKGLIMRSSERSNIFLLV